MKRLFISIPILAATMFIAPQLWAKTFYLKNGEQIEYQSYRQKDGTIFLLINRDTEVEFAAGEVDLPKTVKAAEKEKKKAPRKNRVKRAHHKGSVKPLPMGKPATAAKPVPAAQPAAKPAPAPAKAKPAAAAQAGSPALQRELTALYEQYHKKVQAGDLEGMATFATAKNRESMKTTLAKAHGPQKLLVKKMMQAMCPSTYAVTGSTATPDGRSATLSMKGKMSFMGKESEGDGTVNFVREENQWKIDKEAWNSKG